MCKIEKDMNFLKECAARLDNEASAESVLEEMRARYKTPRSLNVKCCLVRRMCQPSAEYRISSDLLCEAVEEEDPTLGVALHEAIARNVRAVAGSRLASLLSRLPHRLSPNVYSLRATHAEVKECKRLGVRQALVKNRVRVSVNATWLLREARASVAHPEAARNVATLALALMLVTGRRTCEVLNGVSSFVRESDYALRFSGQAKKRIRVQECESNANRSEQGDEQEDEEGDEEGDEEEDRGAYSIPTLAPVSHVVAAFEVLRRKQECIVRSNRETSLKYQAWLGQTLRDQGRPWSECGHVHALRGLYACMAVRLFDWRDASDAYVTMSILGHASLHESLVYTTYALGDEFCDEPRLGRGPDLPEIEAD